MTNRLYGVTLMLAWQSEEDLASVAAEIARDLEGTVKGAFREFLEQREVTVKALVVIHPIKEKGE